MDNEKYGIELELITGKFNSQMEKVKAEARSIQKAFDPNDISGLKITGLKETISGVKTLNDTLKGQTGQLSDVYERQRQSIKSLGDEAEKTAQKINSTKYTEYYDSSAIQQVVNANEQLMFQTDKITKKQSQYNAETDKTIQKQKALSASSSTAGMNISNGLDKMTTKIRRFGLALLSVRSIYSLVSRASSAYLAQDTELANKLQSAWIGLGAILAPIINFIATLILKLVSIINMFVKALTGVDLIAKASAKSMKGAAGSANSLKKALAGFDELQNLDTDAGGAGGVGLGGVDFADAFANIDADWKSMMDGFYETLDKVSKNGIEKVQNAKKKVVTILEDMGFAPGVIRGFSNMMDGISQLWQGLIKTVKGVFEIIDGIVSLDVEKIKQGFIDFFGGQKDMWTGWSNIVGGIIEIIVSAIGQAWDTAKKWTYDKFIKPVKDYFSGLFDTVKKKAIEIGEKAGEIIGGAFKAVVNKILSATERILNSPIRAINSLIGAVNKLPGVSLSRLSTFSLPRLDVGTNYVPEDQLAMIHKGEAVIPKKFNSQEYFGNNDETNELLKELIDRVGEIEINPYTTIKDVGRASLNYINNKTRQLGESVVV